ncbi:hypothetical protein G7Y89_g14426 [Cudoniella acicularis]|uniref:DUF221-domain-containing protein n=1 Tax=Cudoniella acicularis TaxID=354080 RepID=A0A8H4R2B5_9HELO|nr:hypothetical protein G7Y89_g14426 [Cudoniella acicularis]
MSASSTSNSVSGFLSTLIPVGLQAIAFFATFLILRTRIRYQRVYRPRTYLEVLHDEEKSRELPEGKFSWLSPFRQIPDEYVLNHQSLDGYLYLRFIKMLTVICFVGACLTFPVLFPVNATGHGGQTQFDILSFSNISNTGKNRYYAHVFIGWIFFSRISSRTVLFTDVPTEYLNKERLHQLFGASLRRCWLSTDCKDLEDLVEEREKDALKLESAEIKLCQTANKRRLKWEKKNDKRKDASAGGGNAELASPGARYQKPKDRPTHRLGKIPLIGKKVDTINWTRQELKKLTPQIEKSQLSHRQYKEKLIPTVFVEFNTLQAAEAAYRRMSPRKDPKMNPRAIATAPDQVIWGNLRIKKTERAGRKFATNTFLFLMILFWSIPVAVVGAISNINYLTDRVPFLSFINHIPGAILGVVTGLLPSVLLSVLMALVPIVCRLMSKLSGEVTLPAVELKTQSWYMAFQVVQVFLITTFSSGAASVVTQIINDPGSATTLLAENLPKASNFFISYIIVQGLGIAAGNLLNIGALATFTVLGKLLDKSPRKMFKRYITLGGLGWGSLYPKFGNLGVIAITYSIIAPLVLGFATVGFAIVYFAVRYNALFVLTNNIDTKGRAYAHALQQLMTGVYLGEICLLGLFAINTAPGPIVLQAVFLGATVIYHATMRHALHPLTQFLPDSLDRDDQLAMFSTTDHKSYDASKASLPPSEATPSSTPSKFSSKKSTFLSRLFDSRKFISHQNVMKLVPDYPAPIYEEEEAELAYFNPAVTSEAPVIWIVYG